MTPHMSCLHLSLNVGESFNHLMVVGGYGENSVHFDVEIIDLSKPDMICPKPENFEYELGSVGVYINDTVLVCGGGQLCGINSNSECYTLDQDTLQWSLTDLTMIEERSCAAAAIWPNTNEWWVTGGEDEHA